MSKYHIGDTFKIEVAEVFQGAESGNDKYRIKGFDNLVFDEKGLNRLEPIKIKTSVDDFKFGDIVCRGPFDAENYYVVVNAASDRLVGVKGEERIPFFLAPNSMMVSDRVDADIVIKYINGEISWVDLEKNLLEAL